MVDDIGTWIDENPKDMNYIFAKVFSCPDCKRSIMADKDEIVEYNFCPICEKRMIEEANAGLPEEDKREWDPERYFSYMDGCKPTGQN